MEAVWSKEVRSISRSSSFLKAGSGDRGRGKGKGKRRKESLKVFHERFKGFARGKIQRPKRDKEDFLYK